jgi:hypothetical protein
MWRTKLIMIIITTTLGIIEDSYSSVVVDSRLPGYDVVQVHILLLLLLLLITDTGSDPTRTGSSRPVVFAISNVLVLLPQNCLQMASISTMII